MNMPSRGIPADQLLQLLTRLQDTLSGFVDILLEEESVMTRPARGQVVSLNEKKERALDLIRTYEKELVAIMRPWVPSGIPSDCLVFLAQHPEGARVATHPLFRTIRATIQRIRDQGHRNVRLLHKCQHVVREAISLASVGLGHGPVYQGTGMLQRHAIPGSVNIHG